MATSLQAACAFSSGNKFCERRRLEDLHARGLSAWDIIKVSWCDGKPHHPYALDLALSGQEEWQKTKGVYYNEIIVDMSQHVNNLPGSVTAIFFPKNASKEEANKAREAHWAFMRFWDLSEVRAWER